MDSNQIETLPESFGELTHLEELYLTRNEFSRLFLQQYLNLKI